MTVYGNGFDYAARALDLACRNTPEKGNFFVLELELTEEIDWQKLLDEIPERIKRLIHGHWRRAWNLAPCWKMGGAHRIPVTALTDRFFHTPLPAGCSLAVESSGLLVRFKFSHLLFDGGGAERFLDSLLQEEKTCWPEKFGEATPGLTGWKEKFLHGRTVNRYFIACRRVSEAIFTLPVEPSAPMQSALRVFEAEPLLAAAGPFQLGTFLVAASAKALARLRDESGAKGRIFLPSSVDLRLLEPERGVFFNQWSCLPFDFAEGATMETARRELVRALESKLPQAFAAANMLTRIMPLPLMRRQCETLFAGTAGSAMFACIGESALHDSRVTALRHYPAMPPVPGIGVFFNRFRDRFNLILTHRRFKDAERLADYIAEELPR